MFFFKIYNHSKHTQTHTHTHTRIRLYIYIYDTVEVKRNTGQYDVEIRWKKTRWLYHCPGSTIDTNRYMIKSYKINPKSIARWRNPWWFFGFLQFVLGCFKWWNGKPYIFIFHILVNSARAMAFVKDESDLDPQAGQAVPTTKISWPLISGCDFFIPSGSQRSWQ